MMDRIMGVLRLDAETFEAIEADQNATTEAGIIIVLVAVLSGIGTSIGSGNFFMTFLITAVWAIIGWFIWAGLTLWIGTNFFDGKSDLGQMLRVVGYAQVPRVLGVLNFIPCIGPLISLAAGIWALAAAVVAVRQGLDLEDSTKAIIVVFIGWLVVMAGSILIGIFVAGTAIGLGALTG